MIQKPPTAGQQWPVNIFQFLAFMPGCEHEYRDDDVYGHVLYVEISDLQCRKPRVKDRENQGD